DHGTLFLPGCFLLAEYDVLQHLVDVQVSRDSFPVFIALFPGDNCVFKHDLKCITYDVLTRDRYLIKTALQSCERSSGR
ncbi:hypothetical protein ALC57_03233, partial [Trachymyrmex cornetzi]